MKKRFSIMMICIVLLTLSTSVLVSAEDEHELPRLTDMAYLLTDDEYDSLLERLNEISLRQGCDVVIITVAELDADYTPTEFADDVFDYYGFGLGEDRSGILLLISMAERDWAISTRGYGITAFTDAGQEYIIEQIKSDLSNDDFASAFNEFASQCDAFLTQAKTDKPYDHGNLPVNTSDRIFIFAIFIAIGCGIAFCIVNKMKSKLKSVHNAVQAGNYTVPGSFNLRSSSDTFISRRVTRTVKQTDDSSSGGSSTHTSSSGATHGGSSGKF